MKPKYISTTKKEPLGVRHSTAFTKKKLKIKTRNVQLWVVKSIDILNVVGKKKYIYICIYSSRVKTKSSSKVL